MLDFQYFSIILPISYFCKFLIFNKITVFHSFWKITLVTFVTRWVSANLQVSDLYCTFATVLWNTENFRRSRSRSRYGLSGSCSSYRNSSLTILIDGSCVGYVAWSLHYNGIYASDCNIRYNLATERTYLWHGRGNDSKLRQ